MFPERKKNNKELSDIAISIYFHMKLHDRRQAWVNFQEHDGFCKVVHPWPCFQRSRSCMLIARTYTYITRLQVEDEEERVLAQMPSTCQHAWYCTVSPCNAHHGHGINVLLAVDLRKQEHKMCLLSPVREKTLWVTVTASLAFWPMHDEVADSPWQWQLLDRSAPRNAVAGVWLVRRPAGAGVLY